MSRAERNTNYLGLKPHLNQSKTKCKMHINLNAKSKDCSRRGGGMVSWACALICRRIAQFRASGQRQMLISNEILWTIQLGQIVFYHPTRRHLWLLSHKFSGPGTRFPSLSRPGTRSPSISHSLSLALCVCSPQDIHFAAAAAALSWPLSVLSSEQVKRKGEK